MEINNTVQLLYKATQRLSESSRQIFKLATNKAETERSYRIALSQEIIRLRSEGTPATIIGDLSRGAVAEKKFERDVAAEMYRAGLASMEALKAEINAIQSIAKYTSDL